MSPKAALRLLVDEVIHTSGQRHTVGKKVLALCIPRHAVQSGIETGRSAMIATQPNEHGASFCYFDPTYSELQQFGPAVTCAGRAVTDVTTEDNPLTGYQSSSLRILALPKEDQSPPSRTAIFKRPQTPRPVIGFELGISVDDAVAPGSVYAIPAAIKNTGDAPIAFAQNLSDSVGQEVPPSVQGGAVPAITLGWPTGAWSINQFAPVSRKKFAGLTLAPGEVFKFNFGSFTVPKAPMGSTSISSIVDLSIRFTDTITGQFSAARNVEFDFPTKVGPTLRFRIDAKSASSGLAFARRASSTQLPANSFPVQETARRRGSSLVPSPIHRSARAGPVLDSDSANAPSSTPYRQKADGSSFDLADTSNTMGAPYLRAVCEGRESRTLT